MRPLAETAGQEVVSIVITPDHVAVLDPPVPLLEPLLEFEQLVFRPGGTTGVKAIQEKVTLCGFDHKGRLAFPAGLIPRVRRALDEAGLSVVIQDQRPADPRLAVDRLIVKTLTPDEQALLEAVRREPLGQVEVGRDEDAVRHVHFLGRAFPGAKFVVAVATRRRARGLCYSLNREFGQQVGLATASRRRGLGGRWLVGTFGSIPPAACRGAVLLLPFGEEMAGAQAIDLAVGGRFARRYAFVRPQRRPDRLVQLRLEQAAGPVIRSLVKPRVPVRVVMVRVPPCPAAAAKSDALGRKRGSYWHHAARNTMLAAVARAVDTSDWPALQQAGLTPAALTSLQFYDRRTAVVVESPEHGRQMLAELPDWPMWTLMSPEATLAEPTSRGIVTAAFAATHAIGANVVVRATGTEWPLRLKGFPPRTDACTAAEVVVIDAADSGPAWAVAETARRVTDYRRRGMEVVMAAG